jgi:pectate lyase
MDALMTPEPRIIVFQVSGVITLVNNGFEPNGPYSYVTIAGQTSPGTITLTGTMSYGAVWNCYGACIRDNFHDGIIRFLRFRSTGGGSDGITMEHSHDFILDHCDISGGGDETADMAHDSNYTVQWCTISNSVGGAYPNIAKGSLMGYPDAHHISLHHNLFAHHYNRGPAIHWAKETPRYYGLFDYRNNVCYNFTQYSLSVSSWTGELRLNVVGNTFKEGPATEYIFRNTMIGSGEDASGNAIGTAALFHDDNCTVTLGDSMQCDMTYRYGTSIAGPWPMAPVTAHKTSEAYDLVLTKAGVVPHDAMNIRTADEVRNGTGVFGKVDDPFMTTGPAPPADTDRDGMPDFWETAMGFNPGDPSDNNRDHDSDGYLNIEEYINDVALARLCEDYYNSIYPIPNDWPDYNPACCKSLVLESGPLYAGLKNSQLSVHPNPLVGNGTVRIRMAGQTFAGNIRIIDMQGRLVKQWQAGSEISWNSRDSRGRPVAPGIYLVHAADENRVFAKKRMVVIR